MNTRRDKRRFWAAVLCALAVLAMTIRTAGSLDISSVYAAGEIEITVDGNKTELVTNGTLKLNAKKSGGQTLSEGDNVNSIEWSANPDVLDFDQATGSATVQVTAKNTVNNISNVIITAQIGSMSGSTSINVKANAHTVTYKVEHGSWSDGTKTNKEETVRNGNKPGAVPGKGTPDTGYGNGSWNIDPTNVTITENKVFTYSFEPVSTHVSVTSITLAKTSTTAGTDLVLSGTVAPNNASNKTITWSLASAGTTGATLSGSTLSTKTPGTVVVTATITNGKTATTPFTQDFSITVNGTSTYEAANNPADTGISVGARPRNLESVAEGLEKDRKYPDDYSLEFRTEVKDPEDNKKTEGKSKIDAVFSDVKKEVDVHYLDISAKETYTNSNGKAVEKDVTDTLTPVETPVYIKNPGEYFVVLQYHDGNVRAFEERNTHPTEEKNYRDASFYYEKGWMYIYSRYYSTFAIITSEEQLVTVTFDTDGGSYVDPVVTIKGEKIDEPTKPTKTDHTFDGWYFTKEYKDAWTKDNAISADTVLFAKWTKTGSNSNSSNSASNASTANNTATNTNASGQGNAAAGGRGVSSPQTSDRIWTLWGVILFIVIVNGAYIALAARKGKKK